MSQLQRADILFLFHTTITSLSQSYSTVPTLSDTIRYDAEKDVMMICHESDSHYEHVTSVLTLACLDLQEISAPLVVRSL